MTFDEAAEAIIQGGGVDMNADLRRLEEDFQRNLQRTQKVFHNRMDNLQRSQIEREAQHQKTLERHQKERAEFERRLAQEEEQQNKRLEQLQREWERKRVTLAQQRTVGQVVNTDTNGAFDDTGSEDLEDLPQGLQHRRNASFVSIVSSASAASPVPSETKKPTEDNGNSGER
jgi:hypothetical protein